MALDSEIDRLERYKRQVLKQKILKYKPPPRTNSGPPEKFDSLQFISSDDILPKKRQDDE